MLIVSECSAFLFAIIFVVTFYASLPPSDAAYGTGPFSEPLVIPLMSMVAFAGGMIVWPFYYTCLRQKRLHVALPIVTAATVLWIVLATPFSILVGFFGSFAVLIVSLQTCYWALSECYGPEPCSKCGYDLTGNVSGVCPECGESL